MQFLCNARKLASIIRERLQMLRIIYQYTSNQQKYKLINEQQNKVCPKQAIVSKNHLLV